MSLLRHGSGNLRVQTISGGLSLATYGGDVLPAEFPRLRALGLFELEGAKAALLDVRNVGPLGLDLPATVTPDTYSESQLMPAAMLVRPEHALEWSMYALHTGRHGVTRVVFTDPRKAHEWLERQLERPALW
jgi:hypothetical protein